MKRSQLLAAGAAGTAIAAGVAALLTMPAATAAHSPGYEPVLNPADFVKVIDNPYFPLPVGRTLIYRGIKDGKSLTDRFHVTSRTKKIEGITATAVSDVSRHRGKLLEKTTDWYAQDKHGTVWYLGENTEAFLPGGKVDRSGSWQAGVRDAEPGIVMKAHPAVPQAYRQEFMKGNAEDTAWTVIRGGKLNVPAGKFRHVLTSLEFSRLEPGVIDQKIYAPGIGILREQAVRGPTEVATLVRVIG
ncbi:MAG: hypothetical protein LBV34_19655 [Nocardiopsaceae bacterium]|nr:hypothetical protein [Nocardiopsaceae bacterium]